MRNSKDMESTQMPVSERLYKENVLHIYHGILCSHKKEQDHVLCRDINGAGSCYLQQTNAGTQTPHFSHGHRERNNPHWGLLWGWVGAGEHQEK